MCPAHAAPCPTAADAAARIAAGRLTPLELLDLCLARIRAREPAVQAWERLDEAGARAVAADPPEGPLHGIPVAVKDIVDTADLPTGYGSPAYAGHRPARDAVCVASLRRAGAVVLGKTVTTEFASSFPGKTRNPHDPARTPGGSSSGSAAAVADGMAPLALGTQTAGSVIRPASYCGAVGYKGTFGWTDMTGVHPLSPSFDTLGVYARRVADIALARRALATQRSRRLVARRPRVGLCRTPVWSQAQPESRATVERARDRLSAAGAEIHEVALPASWDGLVEAHKTIMGVEMASVFGKIRSRHGAQLSASLLKQLDEGAAIAPDRARWAFDLAERARDDLGALMRPGDVWITPAAPGEAPQGLGATGDPVFNRLWSLLGTPCVSLPVGRGPNGLPVGLQLVGTLGADDDLLDAALWVEEKLTG